MTVHNPYRLNISTYSTHTIILDQIPPHSSILDVGCNDGYIGELANQKGCETYALDNAPSSVEKALKTNRAAIIYDANMTEKLPWDRQFDVVIFADILEHLINPEKVLTFFAQNYMHEKSIAIISLPNVANWLIRIQLILGNFDGVDAGILDRTHLHLYTYKTARKLVFDAGLEPHEEFGGASLLGPIIKIAPVLRTLLATNIILVCKKKSAK